jgi:hypothetical protein
MPIECQNTFHESGCNSFVFEPPPGKKSSHLQKNLGKIQADFLVRKKVALTHVKQQQCIWFWFELSNAFDCGSRKENILLNTENKRIIGVLTGLGKINNAFIIIIFCNFRSALRK